MLPGKAEDHGEVALLHAVHADGQDVARGEGHVVVARIRGLAIGAGVDAEDAEVAGVARPHPVVRIAAELADGAGRRTHQAHIAEGLGDDEEVTGCRS